MSAAYRAIKSIGVIMRIAAPVTWALGDAGRGEGKNGLFRHHWLKGAARGMGDDRQDCGLQMPGSQVKLSLAASRDGWAPMARKRGQG